MGSILPRLLSGVSASAAVARQLGSLPGESRIEEAAVALAAAGSRRRQAPDRWGRSRCDNGGSDARTGAAIDCRATTGHRSGLVRREQANAFPREGAVQRRRRPTTPNQFGCPLAAGSTSGAEPEAPSGRAFHGPRATDRCPERERRLVGSRIPSVGRGHQDPESLPEDLRRLPAMDGQVPGFHAQQASGAVGCRG